MGSTDALIVVDLQNDFVEGGALAVQGGLRVAKDAYNFVKSKGWSYDLVISTQDWHIDPGPHWSEDPDFKDSWPKHCEAKTPGAELVSPFSEFDFDFSVFKGQYQAAYSGFEGRVLSESRVGTILDDLLKRQNIDQVDVCGLAFDYCVKETALGAALRGYKTRVLADLTAAVHRDRPSVEKTIRELREAGVEVV